MNNHTLLIVDTILLIIILFAVLFGAYRGRGV